MVAQDKSPLGKPLICPRCDGEVDALIKTTWGSGPKDPDEARAPYVCSLCGSVCIIDLSDMTLTPITEEMLKILKTNASLWEAIETARAFLATVPNRRKILR